MTACDEWDMVDGGANKTKDRQQTKPKVDDAVVDDVVEGHDGNDVVAGAGKKDRWQSVHVAKLANDERLCPPSYDVAVEVVVREEFLGTTNKRIK